MYHPLFETFGYKISQTPCFCGTDILAEKQIKQMNIFYICWSAIAIITSCYEFCDLEK